MKKDIFLEKPIEKEEEDLFSILSHVEQLQSAIIEGANFIAVDGEHGSGKSSIINLLEKKEKENNNKNKFVNINFLNIGEDTIENYHRYFVNQVANDICDDPFEIENIFYHNHISYSVTNPSKNRIWRIIVDKLLLFLTSFMVIYLTYSTFLKSIEVFQFIFKYSDIYVPIILLTMFALVIIYGYGIYKPENQEQSPMLETDKCRTNFCKIVSTKLPRNMLRKRKDKTRLFLIIDDLDRIVDKSLQVKIISLLYNEYYPLKLKHAELYFIFMLDTAEIESELEKVDLESEKLFDYILPVSNNQKHIIRHLTNNMINNSNTLSAVFNNNKIENKDYIINLICQYYPTIRKIKHFFNKLIAKYNYLITKEVQNINYGELIIVTMLLDMAKTSVLDIAISNTINNEPIKTDLNDNIKSILSDSKDKKIFDIDYYVYLYNFINIEDMLNHNESELYSISEKGYSKTTLEEDEKIIDYLETDKVRFDKVYHEIFFYLDNDTKMIFTASKKFCDSINKISKVTKDINIRNAYKNNYGYYLCDNLILDDANRNEMIFDLKQSYDTYLSQRTPPNAQILNDNFIEFLENMNSRIIQFNLKDYFLLIPINDTIFESLFEEIKYNNHEIGFELINKEIIDCNYIKNYIDIQFIDKINTFEEKLSQSIKTKILNDNNTSFEVLLKIISEENTKYENIEAIYDKMNTKNEFINFDKLAIILKNYGYNSNLDKHIIHCLDTNSSKMIDNINKNNYSLSLEVMNKLNSIGIVYSFTDYYENMFLDNNLYSLYIYSKIKNSNSFDYNTKLKDNENYKQELLNNYNTIYNWASKYNFTKIYTKFILDNFDFDQMEFSNDNYWKITHLINYSNGINDFANILSSLSSKGKLEAFFDYCIKMGRTIDINFIKSLRSYAEEHGMSREIKIKLTKNINKIVKTKK